MNLENLIEKINTIIKLFKDDNESGALEIIKSLGEDAMLLKHVNLDNYQKNKELVEALDGLSEFKKKFENESPNFVTRVYNLGENARKTLKPISEHK